MLTPINFTIPEDVNVQAVIRLLAERAFVGLAKYGVTTEREDLSVLDWIDHHMAELGDALVYMQKLKTLLEPLFSKPTNPTT